MLKTIIIFLFLLILTNQAIDGCQSDKCYFNSSWSRSEVCEYVKCNADACEGGGYLLWTQYVECANNNATKITLIVIGVLYLLLLFVMISSAADDFFSPSISSIVAHLKISESVAGVTFMAFGNGAPDVFGSIASILSSPKPKADLALGELFGGGLFVTTMVVATIVLTSPFKVEVFSTVRDLVFYLCALIFLMFCFIFTNNVQLWMPLTFLGIYVLYVLTVVAAQALHRRQRKNKIASGRMTASVRSNQSTIASVGITVTHVDDGPVNDNAISITAITDAIEKLKDHVEHNKPIHKRPSYAITKDGFLNFYHPYAGSDLNSQAEEDDDEEFVVLHGHVYHGHEYRSRAQSEVPEPMMIESWRSLKIITDLLQHLNPLVTMEEFREMNIVSKVVFIINMVPMVIFKLTIPLNETSWSKPLALIHSFACPMFLLFSIHVIGIPLFPGSPGLWSYCLICSLTLALIIIFFTKLSVQPRFYKEFYSYLGFLMSIAWIYLIASEVVNVVTMLGVVAGISHEILGLTILAWSNSIGDLIADISVVKQGYPRMALAAAIGGPLFNLLMGFGLPFTIAKLNGKYISMAINPTYRLLMLFLGISLIVTLIGIPIQRCHLQRPHAIILIIIYIAFIVFVILSETNTLVWN